MLNAMDGLALHDAVSHGGVTVEIIRHGAPVTVKIPTVAAPAKDAARDGG